jgi:hypothetical protein
MLCGTPFFFIGVAAVAQDGEVNLETFGRNVHDPLTGLGASPPAETFDAPTRTSPAITESTNDSDPSATPETIMGSVDATSSSTAVPGLGMVAGTAVASGGRSDAGEPTAPEVGTMTIRRRRIFGVTAVLVFLIGLGTYWFANSQHNRQTATAEIDLVQSQDPPATQDSLPEPTSTTTADLSFLNPTSTLPAQTTRQQSSPGASSNFCTTDNTYVKFRLSVVGMMQGPPYQIVIESVTKTSDIEWEQISKVTDLDGSVWRYWRRLTCTPQSTLTETDVRREQISPPTTTTISPTPPTPAPAPN